MISIITPTYNSAQYLENCICSIKGQNAEFEHIVVCGGPSLESLEHCTPCGYCRQFMNEFVDQNFKIYLLEPDNTVSEYKITDLCFFQGYHNKLRRVVYSYRNNRISKTSAYNHIGAVFTVYAFGVMREKSLIGSY